MNDTAPKDPLHNDPAVASVTSSIREFLKLESASGILLGVAAAVAMLIANTPLSRFYDDLIDMPVELRAGPLILAKPLILWINDGLMAVFFFLVGLELKREVMEGELSNIRQIALPGIAALGGMVVPAAIYAAVNRGDAVSMEGWAIPAATDIAFALGILSLLGDRVPTSLKVFLVSIAIFDDLGAILLIALFYASDVSLPSLIVAAGCLVPLWTLNRRRVTAVAPYLLIGLVMWVAVLKSGVHATLAGVLLAMFIPMRSGKDPSVSPLKNLEHDLHPAVAFGVLPIFGFANAGISLEGVDLETLMHPVPLGIGLGLFFGKQIGIFGCCWLAVKLKLTELPEGVGWGALYGIGLLCGVGFTMSLFIGSLAFEHNHVNQLFDERLGILVGSLLSGVAGFFVLRVSMRPRTGAE